MVDHIPKIPNHTADTDSARVEAADEEDHRDKDGGEDPAEKDKARRELDEGAQLEDGETRSDYSEEAQLAHRADDHSPQLKSLPNSRRLLRLHLHLRRCPC